MLVVEATVEWDTAGRLCKQTTMIGSLPAGYVIP